MVEIKAGAELKRAVAVAMGLRRWVVKGDVDRSFGLYEVVPLEEVEVGYDDPAVLDIVIPSYSTDLNAAFWAADQVGLFDTERCACCLLFCDDVGWLVEDLDGVRDPGNSSMFYVVNATPALAICAAILTFKELEQA